MHACNTFEVSLSSMKSSAYWNVYSRSRTGETSLRRVSVGKDRVEGILVDGKIVNTSVKFTVGNTCGQCYFCLMYFFTWLQLVFGSPTSPLSSTNLLL